MLSLSELSASVCALSVLPLTYSKPTYLSIAFQRRHSGKKAHIYVAKIILIILQSHLEDNQPETVVYTQYYPLFLKKEIFSFIHLSLHSLCFLWQKVENPSSQSLKLQKSDQTGNLAATKYIFFPYQAFS